MKLLIAISALNEEQSIGAIIERCLAPRSSIARNSPGTAVAVVGDGSTDRTVKVARHYADLHLAGPVNTKSRRDVGRRPLARAVHLR
jgi:hypothetical protein